MRFLDHTWTWDWCGEHGIALVEGEGRVAPRLADDPALTVRQRELHAAAGDHRAAEALAAALTAALGEWDECLVWATDWDVWEDQEDWPRLYAWRGGRGERRSLAAAPGHLFAAGEGDDLRFLLAHAIECGWDVVALPVLGGTPNGVRAHTSHDEWVAIHSVGPTRFAFLAG
jgi:hypothetical protein